MTTHMLKTDREVFQAVWNGKKKFEIRLNDRDFQVGDELLLRETQFTGEEMKAGAPLVYTGEKLLVIVSYILQGPIYGLAENWCIMSIRIPFVAAEALREVVL